MNVKKILSILFVGLFVVSLCGCSNFSERPTGYNGTMWGNSKSEVKDVENIENLLLEQDGTLIYTDFDLSNPISIYGLTISEAPLVEYRFTNGKLSEIVITLESNSVSYESGRSIFDSLKSKYGDAEWQQRRNQYDYSLIMMEWANFETEYSKITFSVMEHATLENEISLTFKPLK